jgi:thiol-disulfide isomerase/thioredoxin
MAVDMLAIALWATWAVAPVIGDPAPATALATLSGSGFGRDQLAGRTTAVEFFASWCLPCRESLEDLRGIRAELGPDLKIVIVAVEGATPAVRAFFAAHPPPPDAVVALDVRGETARRWGEDRLPTTFFLDRAAIIRHINRGHGRGYRARASRWLRTMLDDRHRAD